jgi:hypothetical protein
VGEQTSREPVTLEDGVADDRVILRSGAKGRGRHASLSKGSRPAGEDHEVDEPRGGNAKPMRR